MSTLVTHPDARVLVVEDDAITRHSLTLLLRQAGYAVDACADGSTACEQLTVAPYDILLVDLFLADAVDGLAVIAQAARLTAPPGVIVLTAYGSHTSLAAASDLGVAACLLKPCRPEELLATLEAVARPAWRRQVAPLAQPGVSLASRRVVARAVQHGAYAHGVAAWRRGERRRGAANGTDTAPGYRRRRR